MSKLYNKAEQFVIDSFNNIDKPHQIKHFIRTAYWVKQLEPNSDEALLIAAVAHDIERAFRQKDILEKKYLVNELEFLRPHEERGAEIIAKFLKKEGAKKELINKIKMLVSRHEEGGNTDQNLLKDADSISFFENNVKFFFEGELLKLFGKENVKKKLDWMYNRITSKKAKEIVGAWYSKSIKALAEIPE